MPQCRVYFNGYNTSEPAPAATPPSSRSSSAVITPGRSVVGHDPWSLSEQRACRGSKFPFSAASFDRRAPPLSASLPLLPSPTLPLCSSSYNPSHPRVCDAPGVREQGFRITSHTPRHCRPASSDSSGNKKRLLGLLPQKGLDVRPEVEVGVIWILVDCEKARGQLPACCWSAPGGGDRKQLTSSALCRRRGGLLGLGVRLLGLGDQLLLVLVLVLGGGRALRRRDCPLVVEAVEDAEAEGRVSEDLGAEAGVS